MDSDPCLEMEALDPRCIIHPTSEEQILAKNSRIGTRPVGLVQMTELCVRVARFHFNSDNKLVSTILCSYLVGA